MYTDSQSHQGYKKLFPTLYQVAPNCWDIVGECMCLMLFLDIQYWSITPYLHMHIRIYHTPQHITSVWGLLTLTPTMH